MWILQICIASFWLYLSIHLLFREAVVWESVSDIPWFRDTFGCSSSRKWERFCRDVGLVCLVTACLLFIKLPFGMGAFGIIVALPPLVYLI